LGAAFAGVAWWNGRLQAATDRMVNAAYDEAVRLRTQAVAASVGNLGPWNEAVAATQRAEGLLGTGLASTRTANRIRKLRANVDREATHARMAATATAARRAAAEMAERVHRLPAKADAQTADHRQR
jgi:hypothetical protein